MPPQTTEQKTYLPLPAAERDGIALSLSGGGFRAALFHLGALRRLHELGILQKLTTVSSVSGGSIIAGFLAIHLPFPGTDDTAGWENRFATPFRKFCQNNIRRKPLAEGILPGVHNSEVLADEYDALLTNSAKLGDLPQQPSFVFCATDLAFGVNWKFTRDRIGDYQAGYKNAPEMKLSTAIAASSCFPPVFSPMPLGFDSKSLTGGDAKGELRDKCVRGLTLSDGGVYDNLGLEPIWKNHKIVLCSDGGALFKDAPADKFITQIPRFISIPENQALAV